MPYAIELNIDKESSRKIVKLWETLAEKSINSEMISIRAKPHISLAVLDKITPDKLHNSLCNISKKCRYIPIVLNSVQLFPTNEGVLYLGLEESIELNEIHKRVHYLLRENGYESNNYYKPDKWIPHCTITMGINATKVDEVINLISQINVLGKAELIEMSLIEFRPLREIYSFPLLSR